MMILNHQPLAIGLCFVVGLATGSATALLGAEPPTEIVSTTAVVGGRFGLAVAGAGDINGNGHDDVIIGAQREQSAAGFTGRVCVVDGGTGAVILNLSPPPFFGSWWGESVAGGADIDGDGTNDIVAGSLSSRAIVFSGATGDTMFTLQHPDGEFDTDFGAQIAIAGDFNHDNFNDVIVGAYNQDIDGMPSAGRAYVFGGPDGDLIATLESPFPETTGQFGIAVAAAGDVNNDGWDDVIVGAFIETVDGVGDAGRAYVFSGATHDTLFTLTAPVATLFAEFGNSVAGVGDIDADGHDDVIVGAVQDHTPGYNQSGRAYVFSGATGALIRGLDSPTPDFNGYFGKQVAGIGDYDGDGTGDMVVGAYTEDANAVNGSGRAHVFSGATGLLLDTFESPNTENFGRFGVAVAGAGDVNNDGRPDVIVGAGWEAVDGMNDAGRAYLFTAPVASAAPPGTPRARGFTLEQNHPNPFNPRTTIAFRLERPGRVRLAIYDAKGRRVETLVDGFEEAGRHAVEWDAHRRASGTYFYELSVDGSTATRKTTVIK